MSMVKTGMRNGGSYKDHCSPASGVAASRAWIGDCSIAVRGGIPRVLAALFVGLLLILSCGLDTAPAAECPNELRREGQNAVYLPDCRAYEMVSPLDKNGSDVDANGRDTFASDDGEKVVFGALAGFSDTIGAGNLGFTTYVASREGATGWSTHGVTPEPAQVTYQYTVGATTVATFSEDLGHALVEGYALPAGAGGIPNGINYYSEDTSTEALETITTPLGPPLGAYESVFGMWGSLRGYSSDLDVVTFESEADFLPGTAGSQPKLYQWEHGKLTLAGVLPDGTIPTGGSGAPVAQGLFSIEPNEGTVTDQEGSRVAFVSPLGGPGEKQLYLRRDGTSTALVSESEASSPGPEAENVKFAGMTPNGRKVFFNSSSNLTDSSTPGGGLYMYTDSPSPTAEANLTFIGQYEFVGTNANAQRIYLRGTPPGFNKDGIYLWDEEAWHFVTSMTSIEHIEISQDGRRLAFLAGAPKQMYLYDEERGTTRCVSCMPEGEVDTSEASVIPSTNNGAFTLELLVKPRFMSGDGRYVFFTTSAPLVPRDTNGLSDAYEYNDQTGEVSLLSSGSGGAPSWFAASSESGNDVFILTGQSLVRADTDTLIDLYDVRVGGGFQEPSPQTGPCVGDECQGTPSAAPSFNTASGFVGIGNTPAVTHGKVAKHKARPLPRAKRLSKALKACKARRRQVRRNCQARARKKFGPIESGHKSTSNRARR